MNIVNWNGFNKLNENNNNLKDLYIVEYRREKQGLKIAMNFISELKLYFYNHLQKNPNVEPETITFDLKTSDNLYNCFRWNHFEKAFTEGNYSDTYYSIDGKRHLKITYKKLGEYEYINHLKLYEGKKMIAHFNGFYYNDIKNITKMLNSPNIKYRCFKGQDEHVIHKICEIYDITNYKINDDFTIDVNGNVDVSDNLLYGLSKYRNDVFPKHGEFDIPLMFNKVTGDFKCIRANGIGYTEWLSSLYGSPKYVGGNYNISGCKLNSLKYAPIEVGGNFIAWKNNFLTLKGSPKYIGGNCELNFESNSLRSFEGAPEKIGGKFDFSPALNYTYRLLTQTTNSVWDYDLIEMFNEYGVIKGSIFNVYRFREFLLDTNNETELTKDIIDKLDKYYTIEGKEYLK